MTRKLIVLALIAALVASIAGPAGAKKKKRAPKPYVSEEVSINAGHPVFHGQSETLVSVTAQEFLNTCAIPNSNGVDAYVFEAPANYLKTTATIKVIGEATAGQPAADMDVYMFDDTCAEVGFSNAESADPEMGVMPPGTAYVVIHNYTGGPTTAHYELAPYIPPTF